MSAQKTLLRSAGIATLAFAALIAAVHWPAFKGGYASYFRGFAEFAFGVLGFEEVDFQPKDPAGPWDHDTEILLRDSAGQVIGGSPCPSLYVGYIPTIVFLTLFLATPLALNRRLRALLLGGLLVHLYIFVRLGLLVLLGLTIYVNRAPEPPPHPAFLDTVWWLKLMQVLIDALHKETTVYVAIPVLIWLLVSFRSRELFRVPGSSPEPSPDP